MRQRESERGRASERTSEGRGGHYEKESEGDNLRGKHERMNAEINNR